MRGDSIKIGVIRLLFRDSVFFEKERYRFVMHGAINFFDFWNRATPFFFSTIVCPSLSLIVFRLHFWVLMIRTISDHR